jgi:sulfite reductase (NADPH) flavoprotein alpha-component
VLNDTQWQQLNQLIAAFNSDQMNWVSGYLAGLAQSQPSLALEQPQGQSAPSPTVTILYGSQTGNAKGVAQEFKQAADTAGLTTNLVNMSDFKPKSLKNESYLVIVASTHGEGEPPDDAIELHDFLGGKKAPKLEQLKYAVIGLGDTSYEFFCQTAKDFDERLAALGAASIFGRVDCDVDYDVSVSAWSEGLVGKLNDELASSGQVVAMPGVALPQATTSVQYSKKSPFSASLIESFKITGRDSTKDIRHVEISLEDSGIEYLPGDALGVWFTNDAGLVDELLTLTGINASDEVTVKEESFDIKTALIEKFELTQSYPNFVQHYAEQTQQADLVKLVEDKTALRDFLGVRQIVDIVREFPAKIDAQTLVNGLRPITPRLYSIASSQAEVEDEVHLTVGLVEYEAFDKRHLGGASGFLAERVAEDQEIRIFVESNGNFRLPEDPVTPIIMVGPGTGIAPFRAFMQQREAQEAAGKSWLFFGNPHFTQDFLYQVEWQKYLKDGVLSKMSLAFSRDQADKVYVQHKLLEQGAEVYQWLEEGAHLYVCGDANYMAKDVNDALISLVATHGQKSQEEAEAYVNDLRRAKRYKKDVY